MNRVKIMNAGQLARLLNSVPNDSAVTFRIDGQAAQADTYEVVAETIVQIDLRAPDKRYGVERAPAAGE